MSEYTIGSSKREDVDALPEIERRAARLFSPEDLAPELAAEMVGCDLNPQGILILRVSSPEWAARFRFESEQLLALCRKKRPETQSVKIRVAHPDP